MQYCSSAPKYSAAPPLLAADQPAHVFSSRAPALLMGYDAGGGKWVAGCGQNVKTRDGTVHIRGLSKFPTVLWVALTSASDGRSRMLFRSPVR